MDKNSAIGLVLMFALIFVYFQFFAPSTPPPVPEKPKTSVSKTVAKEQAKAVSSVADSLVVQKNASLFGVLADRTVGTEKTITLSNKDLVLTFNSKGASIERAELTGYKTFTGQPIYVLEKNRSTVDMVLPLRSGTVNTSAIYFDATQTDSSVTFAANGLQIQYVLGKEGYSLKQRINAEGMAPQIADGDVSFILKDDLPNTEKDINNSRVNSTVNYYTAEDGLDNLKESSTDEKKADVSQKINWLSLKSRFFNVGMVPEGGFRKGTFRTYTNTTDSLAIKLLEAKAEIASSTLVKGGISMVWFLGPNKYKTLQTVTEGYSENIYLGIPVVNLINRYFTVNVFYWLENYISNYGIIILLLVVLIRIILFPLNYKSYIGMAKMRVLQPELAEAKAKVGDDTAAQQQEQMRIYQQAGVNPLAGCIPLLLQMPILLSMFNFFPNAIELRQQVLWWSTDLSTYDSIATLPFSLPGYGNHVSLFTILMTLSTLLLTWYNNQTNTMANNQMAIMGYIMPVFFMFILNSLPAGLNFYYLMSNLASLTQQIIIRSTVDDKAIHAKLQLNKERIAKNPQKQGGFQARLANAMKAAEDQKKLQAETKKKK